MGGLLLLSHIIATGLKPISMIFDSAMSVFVGIFNHIFPVCR